MKFRHRLAWPVIRALGIPFLWCKFGYRFRRAEDLPEQYIVLSNHTTDFDPFFVGVSFPKQMYYVASEHISRWKYIYKLVHYLFEPILRYKGTVASSTVKEILKKLRQGDNVCIFAEGGRCWDGVTMPVLPSTGKLVKKADCALVTYKITGGYFASPNWSEKGTRRGPVRGQVVHVYPKEELAQLSLEEINEIIRRDLYEDAYARQLAEPKKYRGRRPAYRMENLLYLCPKCGSEDSLSSHKDSVTCQCCGLRFTYDDYGMLHGTEETTVKELYERQLEKTRRRAVLGEGYSCPTASLYRIEKQSGQLLAQGSLFMDAKELRCGDVTVAVEDISEFSMHGRHALVFSANKVYYELIPEDQGNALKFLQLFHCCREEKTEEKVG